MKLYMPALVYSERNAVRNHAAEMASFGTRAMIVTGKHSSRINGSLNDVCESLDGQGIPYTIFDDVEENPSVETVAKAAKAAVEFGADFFVAVGGGSPMDASKAISILTRNPQFIDEAEKYLYTSFDVEYYPVICIPTTCGTGSEVTQYAVMTLHSSQTKRGMAHSVFAEMALVDAVYLKTSSYKGMVSTCVDALAHLIEAYLGANGNDYNRIYANEGLAIWGKVKQCLISEDAYKAMKDEDFDDFMHASVLAGMAIAHTSTTVPHTLSYPVTYDLHVSHGRAVGIFLPGFLKNLDDQEAAAKVLALLGFASLADFTAYLNTILGVVEIPEDLWERDLVDMMSNPAKLATYKGEVTVDMLRTYIPAAGSMIKLV